jgi:hypothetical protein
MASRRRRGFVRRFWDFVRIVRLPGFGESRDIWKLGPLCVKRWSRRISPTEVRERCRISRMVSICNSMCYVPWFHWTVARWVVGSPADHDTCNRALILAPTLADIHPGNALATDQGLVVIDFAIRSSAALRRAKEMLIKR